MGIYVYIRRTSKSKEKTGRFRENKQGNFVYIALTQESFLVESEPQVNGELNGS